MRMERNTIVLSSLVAAAVAVPQFAFAEDTFQTEAGLGYSRIKSDVNRLTGAIADATYYFDRLPSRPDYPLEQAQFVERAASVGASYGRISFEPSGFDKLSDGSIYGPNFVFASPDSSLIVSGGYQAARSGKSRSPQTSTEFETDSRNYQVSAGLYVAKTTDVLVNWARTTADFKSTGPTGAATQTVTATSVGLSGKHLMRLPGSHYVAITAAVLQDKSEQPNAATEKNRDYSLGATYYPMHVLGITAGISVNRGDDRSAEGQTYSAGLRMFFTPAFSVSVDYQRFEAKAPNNNDDTVALRAALRF